MPSIWFDAYVDVMNALSSSAGSDAITDGIASIERLPLAYAFVQ